MTQNQYTTGSCQSNVLRFKRVSVLDFVREKMLGDILAIPIAFIVGWLASEIQDRFSRKSWETRLKEKTQAAIDAIYEAEKVVPGKGRGAERLVCAVKVFMEKHGAKNCEEAEGAILSVFPLTKLSK